MSRVGLPGTGGGGIDRVAQLPANPQPGTVVYVTADYAPGGAYRASDFDIAVTVRRFSDRRAGFLRGTGEGSISPDIAGIEQIAITQAGTIEVRLSDELDSYFGDAMAIRVGSALVALAQHPGTGAWQSAAGNAQWPLNAVTTVRLVTTDETSGITPEGIRSVGDLGNPRNPLPVVEEDYYHVDPDTDDWVKGLGRGAAGGAPAALLPQTGLSDADMRDHKWKGVLVGLSREDAGSDWRLLTAAGSALGVSINVSAKTITLTHRAADTVAEIAAFLDENDVDEDTTLYSIMVGDTNGSATIQTAPLDRPFVQVFSEGSLPHPTRDQLNALVQRIQSLTFADIGGEIRDAQVPGSFTRDSELTKAFLLSVIGLTSSELDDLVVGARVTGSGSSRAIVVEQKDGSTINLPVPDTTGVTADDHVTAVAFVNNGASIRFTFSEGPTLTVNVPAELRVGVNTVLPQIKAGANVTINRSVAGEITISASGAGPVQAQHIRAGWSTDTTILDAELSASSATDTVRLPTATGLMYLALWRSDTDGGDPSEIHLAGGGNSRNLFGAALNRAFGGVDGKLIVSVSRQNASLLGGENARMV